MTRTAIWKSIASALQGEIASGHYRAGDKLPTEAELSLRFGVNRHTVRRALAEMAASGLVAARRGAGVYVAMTPTDYALGRRVRFHQNVLASGRTPSRQLLRLETRKADAREAEALALPADSDVHVMEGLSLVDGVPLAMFRSVFPAQRFPEGAAVLRSVAINADATATPVEYGLTWFAGDRVTLTLQPD
jgi:GntR family transcriptional regulator, phosphonate transport system regulatory protein